MAQIKDSNIIKTPQVAFDPMFWVPDDVVDVKVKNSDVYIPDSFDDTELELDYTVDQTVPSSDALDEPGEQGILSSPQSFSIISQTVRIGADGRSVVDVVLDLEDIPGAANYEIRVTK